MSPSTCSSTSANSRAPTEADGIVLTQGTDTLEESAFALWLLNDSATHIAATGAMRNPTLPGADGPANVRAAALTALSSLSSELPSTLVFNDEIHDPRFVRKSHVTSTAAFSSGPVLGAIGWISEDTVRLPHRPTAEDVVPIRGPFPPGDDCQGRPRRGGDGRT